MSENNKMEVDPKQGFLTECNIVNSHISNMEKFKSKEYEKWVIWFNLNEQKLKNYLSDPKAQIVIVAITGSKLDIVKKNTKKEREHIAFLDEQHERNVGNKSGSESNNETRFINQSR